MDKLNLIATTPFGLEATVKREVTKLGFSDINVSDGHVGFSGGVDAIVKANIWLRSADRVQLKLGTFMATTFTELFDQTKALPWADWIPKDGIFTVIGKSVKSQLFSVSDCQAIVKKAIVEKLKQSYKIEWFPETGALYKIQVALLKDVVTITIDTSGNGLHKRGYRETAGAAPLKETLAAALIELSYWKKDRVLLDGVCGSGTIPIEAALIARNIAPGINRSFVSEDWHQIDKKLWKEARESAKAQIIDYTPEIYGSDLDPKSIQIAQNNAKKAGVADCIRFDTKPFADVTLPKQYGVSIMNPPYGERMGDLEDTEQLYRDMGKLFKKDDTWSVYVLTSDEYFEKLYGNKADVKRKLFNGMIKVDYYQYLGKRPPKQ